MMDDLLSITPPKVGIAQVGDDGSSIHTSTAWSWNVDEGHPPHFPTFVVFIPPAIVDVLVMRMMDELIVVQHFGGGNSVERWMDSTTVSLPWRWKPD